MDLIFDEADGNTDSTIPAGLSPHLTSDAAGTTLSCGMNSPLTIRYPELAQAPAPSLIGEGLRATYEMVAGSPEVVSGRGDVAYSKGDYGAGLVQIDVVAL